jgi:hypothetical protein
MGALRAAETDAFGMVGIGQVYKAYASGEIIEDDEVALAHGTTEDGYRKASEPMVNIRATLSAARGQGIVDDSQLTGLLRMAKQLHFTQRRFPAILQAAREEGFPEEVVVRLATFTSQEYVDVKASDAVQLLQTIRGLPDPPEPPTIDFSTGLNAGLITMYNRDRRVLVGDTWVPLADIAEHVAVNDPTFSSLNFNALNRALTVMLANIVGVKATDEEVQEEARRFRFRLGLEQDDSFADWLRRNHLNTEDFTTLMREGALCRAMHRWLIYAQFMERTTRLVLDQLRWEDRYEPWAERTAAQQRLIEEADLLPNGGAVPRMSTADLVRAHESWTGQCFDTDPLVWAQEAGFCSKDDLKLALSRSMLARTAVLTLIERTMDEDDGSGPTTDLVADSPPSPGVSKA